MDSTETPEVRRFVQEVFRRVAIPYYTVFSSLTPDKVWKIVKVGLAGDAVARQETVRTRIAASELGTWMCPRRVIPLPHERRTLARGAARSSPRLHSREHHAPGLCEELDTATGQPCRAPLKPLETHLDEFAASFGFLERSTDNYIRGKFGLVADYLRQLATETKAGHFFKPDQAFRGLVLYAFVERHGDLVLPVLHALEVDKNNPEKAFLSLVQNNLALKVRRFSSSQLLRNAAFHSAVVELARHCEEWGVQNSAPRHTSTGKPKERLDPKTISGYFGRTVTYLTDLGLAERSTGQRAALQLSQPGARFVIALQRQGFLGSDATAEIPPSFEAAHDAFGVDWDRYSGVFSPPVTQGTVEDIVRESILPGAAAPYWRASSADKEELKCAYREAVPILAERLTGAARIDVVRLALFAYGLGTGHPLQLEDPQLRTPNADPNANAAVQIAMDSPGQYLLGHARTGRRFWSVAVARR